MGEINAGKKLPSDERRTPRVHEKKKGYDDKKATRAR